MQELLLHADNLSMVRQGRTLVEQVSLDIHRGRIITVVGPNGAGKSSLLKLLLGLERADGGTITKKPGLRIGYMPQKLPLNELFPMPVGRFLSLRNRTTRVAIQEKLALAGVAHLVSRPLSALSGGELQRVLLARAILHEPELLILDEPVQGVDFLGEAELYRVIHSLKERLGCSVLMVSHDLHVVMAATDEVLCLNRHVCCQGTPETVESHPEFLGLFGHAAAADLGLYQHAHTHTHDLNDQGGTALRD